MTGIGIVVAMTCVSVILFGANRVLDRLDDRAYVVAVANDFGIATFGDAPLSMMLVFRPFMFEARHMQACPGWAQALHGEGLSSIVAERRLYFRAHFRVSARSRELPLQRKVVEPDDNRTWTRRFVRTIQQEVVVTHFASRAPPDDQYCAINDQTANIVGRVEPLDGITGHTIHSRFLERRRKFLRESNEHVYASLK